MDGQTDRHTDRNKEEGLIAKDTDIYLIVRDTRLRAANRGKTRKNDDK